MQWLLGSVSVVYVKRYCYGDWRLPHLWVHWHCSTYITLSSVFVLLTRALLGGGFEPPPPLRFFPDSEKTAARSAAGFSPSLPGNNCAHFVKRKFRKFLRVRSPGQVKWPNLQKCLWSCHGQSCWRINMKLSGLHQVINTYKMCILEFWYWWPRVRSFLRPPHYKAMGEKWKPSFRQ